MQGNKNLRLLEETLQTAKTIGEKNVINVLEKAREEHVSSENPIYACIFAVIYKEFRITKKELLLGRQRKNGVRADALCVCTHLISRYIKDCKQTDISITLNKDRGDVCKYMKRINTLNPKLSIDRELMDKIEKAKEILEEKIKKINS